MPVTIAAEPEFLDLPFTRLALPEAIATVARAALGGVWRYVVTPNAAHLARLGRGDAALRSIYARAAFCFLDSRVIALSARLAGLNPPPVVPGSDLVDALFRSAITPATPICIIGGDDDTIARLRTRFGLPAPAHLNPSRGFWRDDAEMADIVAFIVASRADYTFLVVGSPQQEMLAALVAETGGARGVGICAGASLDFLAGTQRRAPRLIQILTLEWAYRLVQEPRRMAHRYFVESPKGVLLVLRAGRRRQAASPPKKVRSSLG